MSIAVLSQVYTEARRLAIAGSVVARGDFRLKKLLPPLQEAGKQAPVFAKVADAATAVIEGPEATSAAALLELTSLVNAVLYTQGETGLAGKLEPVPHANLGGSIVQTSARELKPLLEALSSTGSGRLELVKDAHERGLFRDLRLVKPAIAALDDPYPEIAELIAAKVLPMYGKAILPELHAKYDPKGTKGHPRRLKLMHALDPDGSRELVKSALEDGSKEVKVAAISCLGNDPNDLTFLIEQAAAKSQDVRSAAYEALAKVNHPEALAVLAKAFAGKDYLFAARAIADTKDPKLVDLMLAEVRTGIDTMLKLKDKKKISETADRLTDFFGRFPVGKFPAADKLLLELFARRDELAKIKGTNYSGSDVVGCVITCMEYGSNEVRMALVSSHAVLSPDELSSAFEAGRRCLTASKFFDTFSPYLTAKVDEKKKSKDPAYAKREAIIDAIDSDYGYYDDDDDQPKSGDTDQRQPYDPRWLDLVVQLKRVDLIRPLARPGHPGALALAKEQFDKTLKKAKTPNDLTNELDLLFDLQHPTRDEAFFTAMAKRPKKGHYYHYWFTRLVRKMSKDSIPRLEALVEGMPDSEANDWLDAIQKLRNRD